MRGRQTQMDSWIWYSSSTDFGCERMTGCSWFSSAAVPMMRIGSLASNACALARPMMSTVVVVGSARAADDERLTGTGVQELHTARRYATPVATMIGCRCVAAVVTVRSAGSGTKTTRTCAVDGFLREPFSGSREGGGSESRTRHRN